MEKPTHTQVIGITSGKPGVGKTNETKRISNIYIKNQKFRKNKKNQKILK